MSEHGTIHIPNTLQNFRVPIENSAISYAAISQTEEQPTLFSSKLGGYPYLPRSSNHPKDDQGQDMLLLAQINFAEVKLQKPFPQNGLIQFFISPNLYERIQENPRAAEDSNSFSTRYYPNTLSEDKIVHDFSYLQQTQHPSFPIKKERRVQFTNKSEPVTATDYRIYTFINKHSLEQLADDDGRTYEDIYLEHFLGAEHKIGGYPYFLDKDLRLQSLPHRYYDTLLLQIISDDDDDIMWGNCGVIKFFMNTESLEQLDFSDIYLHVEDY